MVREVFGKGNEFATKITYRARDGKAEDLLQAFRNSLNPRIVVTVDMIATGTDVRPLECLIFMRTVKSRTYFEQMLGRGVRVMDDTEFQSVTDDSKHKDRFIVVDAVGVTDTDLIETTLPLERKPTTNLEDLMKMVGLGIAEPDLASTIAGRLARLDTRLPAEEQSGSQSSREGSASETSLTTSWGRSTPTANWQRSRRLEDHLTTRRQSSRRPPR